MNVFDHPEFDGHERVLFGSDAATGLRAIIAIHDTTRGPALGGCRMWPYASESDALTDVLRLSRGMTYKSAVANLDLGGGKAVIIGDPHRDKTPSLMRAMGRMIDDLGGRYITAEDSGTGVDDLKLMATETRHVVGIAEKRRADGALHDGDPSPATAEGVFIGIQACLREAFGRDDFTGIRVAVQGVGSVGGRLARRLAEAGALVTVSDVREDVARHLADEIGATVAPENTILAADVDVLAPCALGAIINDDSLPRLRARIVAGAANNQLAEPRHGLALADRGILYAPDYVINAGGVIDVGVEYGGYDAQLVQRRIEDIGNTLTEIFRRVRATGRPSAQLADELARERLQTAGH
ncbi:MAG TPA: Glu/Leu/Phe/Val dehydrogenase dimerization domain-containing protein [Gammaproteobacteria bacterium]|nr:Glu/Leu/Phe/Val dehydrogenase dimerization domain-containing protein [Gammaproteobacteria bacterium]